MKKLIINYIRNRFHIYQIFIGDVFKIEYNRKSKK